MNTSIKMNTPCEFINITPINPLISQCQIKVCYVSDKPNRNKSVITKEVGRKLANSLPGSPIVGFYNEEKEDFEGHNRIIDVSNGKFQIKDTTRPYGFVDLNAKCWFQKFLEDGGIEREYLMTEGYLWTGQYPEAQRIINKGNNQSMELDKKLIDAQWSKNTNGEPQFFIINEAIISKLCVLGEDVAPCFEGAQITKVQFSFEDDFKQQLFSMIEQMKEILNEGGTLMGDNNTIEASVINTEDTTTVEETPVVDDNEPVIENPTSIEEGETPETNFSKEENEDGEEVCPECGKVKSECHCDEKNEDKKDKYNLDEIQEYVELSTKYSELEAKYNDLESNYNSIKAENEELINFKNSVEKKEKQNMIDSFWMLSEDDKKEVQENIDTYSLDDIEGKLSIICVRNKVSFDLEEDKKEQTNPIAYNLNEVKDENTPAWIKAVQLVAKNK